MVLEGIAWAISIAGWIISPIISKTLDKFMSHSESEKRKTLQRLLAEVLPRLTLTLEAAEALKHSTQFQDMVRGLKTDFYEMEDILDVLEYIRHLEELSEEKTPLSEQEKKIPGVTSGSEAGPSNQVATNSQSSASLSWAQALLPDGILSRILCLDGNRENSTLLEKNICIKTLNSMLKNSLMVNMSKIEKRIETAQSIIPLAKFIKKRKREGNGKKATAKNTPKLTTSTPKVKVTGRDEDRKRISEMLREDDVNSECFSAIGIYGISGSGKTTLAQHVCKHEGNEKHFDLVMWIHVSQNYSVDDIFKQMFEAASVNKKKSCRTFSSRDILEKQLGNKLEGKRFLLVLDDIWCNIDKQQLLDLLSPLKVGKRGSKILATGCNKDAFSDLGPGVACTDYPIPDLDTEVFLELFMYYAVEGANPDDEAELRIIGADIARKLKGSPLAASTVGGQLRKSKNDVEFWREVRDRDLLNETTGALWWSYQHLDEEVRRCFAYCGIFPRRRHFNRDELVKLWVAEGFIQTADAKQDMETVGRGYFRELLATSFVQPGGRHRGSDCYIVHDLMHDLAEKAAGSDCFRIENPMRQKVPRDVRHLFVANAAMVTDEIFELENLRTLIIDDTEMLDRKSLAAFDKEFFKEVFKKLKKLRVLSVAVETKDDVKFDLEVPETIDHLMHLRYFGLVIPGAKLVLPKTLAKLYHLQVLMFGYRSSIMVSTDTNMGNLTKLRHIIGIMKWNVPYVGRLTALQTLEVFNVQKKHGYELKQLGDLNKLRGNLMIDNLQNVGNKEAAAAKLADKKGLRELGLCWNDDRTCTPEILKAQTEVLEALCPPEDLRSLEIEQYYSPIYPSWMLGGKGPKSLRKLELTRCNRLGRSPELFKFFINLRELSIAGCCWVEFPDGVKNLNKLKSLEIINCWYLTSLPELPGSLQKFELVGEDNKFLRSCKRENDPNWQKLQHVVDKNIRVGTVRLKDLRGLIKEL